MPRSIAPRPLLTVGQAAEYLGVHHDTVYDWAAVGDLPTVRLRGRLVRFRPEDLDARIASWTAEACRLATTPTLSDRFPCRSV